MTNILDLTVDGRNWDGPALDVINRGRRYDPLIQLISNGRLKTLRFKAFPRFFSHVSTSFTTQASQLQVLKIEVRKEDKEVDIRRVVPRILEGCHSLINLTLYIDDMWLSLSLDLVIEKLGKMARLEILNVRRVYDEMEVVVMSTSEGRIETVEARFPSLTQSKKSDQEFIDRGLLTKVTVGINHGEEALLSDILWRNPLMSHFQIECVDASVPAVIETVTSTRIAILERGNASALQKLEVVAKDRRSEFLDVISSAVEFQGKDKTPIMSINIKKSGGRYLHGSDYLNVIFSQYGFSLEELWVVGTSDKHARFLDNATKENGSKLISFQLDLTSLTRVGLESMDRVIERSHSLREFGLHLDVSDGSQLEKAKHIFDRYSDRLTGLYLTVNSDEDWIPKIKELCSSRHRLPELSEFRLDYRSSIPWPSLTWICTMISSPLQRSDAWLTPQLSDGSFIMPHESASVETRTWKPLTRIQLANFRLDPDEWRIVVRAIDFSVLKSLSFRYSNFGLEDLKMLVDRISDYGDFEVPLVTLDLFQTNVGGNSEQLKRLKTMIPLVEVEIDLQQK
ncbi:hypothetical protein EDD21DRAFT_382676 [Dissophora ornata]|nr:hypothetical protein EDD21DRAFT_382676 [Dissophora ornata]